MANGRGNLCTSCGRRSSRGALHNERHSAQRQFLALSLIGHSRFRVQLDSTRLDSTGSRAQLAGARRSPRHLIRAEPSRPFPGRNPYLKCIGETGASREAARVESSRAETRRDERRAMNRQLAFPAHLCRSAAVRSTPFGSPFVSRIRNNE